MFDFLRASFPLNRVVAILTPPVAALAGIVSAWLADHLPFIAEQVGPDEVKAIFVTIAASVVALAYKWLDGWQQHEVVSGIVVDDVGEIGAPEGPSTDVPPAGL